MGGDMDIGYISEIDPTWTDSSLTTILNPGGHFCQSDSPGGWCSGRDCQRL